MTPSSVTSLSTRSAENSTATILAVGAAGDFAGLVVPALARRGARVRGLIRNAEEADLVRRHGASEVAVGDLRDIASLDAALEGIHSVFYIAPAFIPDEAEIGKGMVDAAKRAAVRRFVFSSVIDPILSTLVNHGAKAPVEESLLASDMEYTLLHPTLFFQNFARSWPSVVKSGVYSEPWSAQSRFTRVDYRDVAEVAAIALTEDRLLFGTFELCAEGNLNRDDVATLMSEVLGRKVAAGTLRVTDAKAKSENVAEENQAAAMQAMFDWYDAHSLLGNPLILRAILGREPRTLRAYFEELFAESRTAVTA
jgi:uncharacterized protein YbjT (DUF2867 family)